MCALFEIRHEYLMYIHRSVAFLRRRIPLLSRYRGPLRYTKNPFTWANNRTFICSDSISNRCLFSIHPAKTGSSARTIKITSESTSPWARVHGIISAQISIFFLNICYKLLLGLIVIQSHKLNSRTLHSTTNNQLRTDNYNFEFVWVWNYENLIKNKYRENVVQSLIL